MNESPSAADNRPVALPTTGSAANPNNRKSAVPPGRYVVFGMLAFGVFMVLLMWLYWELHTRPFRPLQLAIAAAYPDSSPMVVGGKHKSHKVDSVNTLRIAVRVPPEEFDPTVDTARSEVRAAELYRLAGQHLDLKSYEVLEIHLLQRDPEKEEKIWSKIVPRDELEKAFSPGGASISM